MSRKKAQGINGTSAADMAFMLLLFFLMTSSMDTDKGLSRRLPPPIDKNQKQDQDVNKRNVLQVRISSTNEIMCGGDVVNLAQLKAKAKEFIENPNNSEHLPVKKEVEIPHLGLQMVTSEHLISLQCDRGTEYQVYIDVQNELDAAYNELRDEAAMRFFTGTRFKNLDEERQKAISEVYLKQKISEAEPKSYGDIKKKK